LKVGYYNMSVAILSISIIIQFIAVFLCVRLVRHTGRWGAWSFVAIALALMGVRRSITLYHTIIGNVGGSADFTTELVALTISVLMMLGTLLIGPIFKSVTDTRASLEESEAKYKSLFENSADATLIVQGDRFVDCNAAAVRMLGYDGKTELLSSDPSDWAPVMQPDGRSSFEKGSEIMMEAYRDGSRRFEWQHRRKNGETFPVEVLLTANRSGETDFLHVVWRCCLETHCLFGLDTNYTHSHTLR
jgi:PAS domain S-box-containing protein